jgi:hypothetical protein
MRGFFWWFDWHSWYHMNLMNRLLFVFSIFLLCCSARLSAQLWSGIIDPSRAVDWSMAGVAGGIPSATWAQCGSTVVASGATSSSINAAIAACAANHYVLLGPGTFSLAAGIDFAGRSNVVLRGAGADQTLIKFTNGNGCHGGYGAWVDVCIYSSEGNWSGGPSNTANWTAGYSAGTTSITLSSVAHLHVGQPLMLDQNDDAADTGSMFVCQSNSITPPCSLEGNSGATRSNRDMSQIVVVASCDGNSTLGHACSSGTNVGITPGLYTNHWASGQSPGAWWATSPVTSVGIENLSLDHTSSTGNKGIIISDCSGCWVSGVRSIDSGKAHIEIVQSAHTTIQNDYFYLTQSSISQSYGVEALNSANDLYINNISQYVASPWMMNGPCMGCVVAYNFSINDYYVGSSSYYLLPSALQHTAGSAMILYEGNVGGSWTGDNFHGTHNLVTSFRDRWAGDQPTCANSSGVFGTCNGGIVGLDIRAYSRFYNIIGGVLGTSGVHNGYTSGSQPIFALGEGNTENGVTVPSDSLVATTRMFWGNYDTVTGAVRWCGRSTDTGWNTTCSSTSEVPTSLSSYANAVPSTETLPASFFLSSKPVWWPSGKAWPPIGPDVTGGNIPGVGGHANTIPAQDCYLSIMAGPVNGTGNALSFNTSTCYGAQSAGPSPPTNLTISSE